MLDTFGLECMVFFLSGVGSRTSKLHFGGVEGADRLVSAMAKCYVININYNPCVERVYQLCLIRIMSPCEERVLQLVISKGTIIN